MELNGLILCGGQSQRYGSNKWQVVVDNEFQYVRIKNVLLPYCRQVFVSCRSEQAHLFEQENLLLDGSLSAGPMSGLVSAINYNAHCAWLIVACDWLNVDTKYIEQLCTTSIQTCDAVCFTDAHNNKQPLLSIYKPSIFDTIKQTFDKGNKSPKNILDTANCLCLPGNLLFFNSKEEFNAHTQ